MVLQADPGRLLSLLEYVRYQLSAQIQARAIGVMALLAARMPGLPDLLLQADAYGASVNDSQAFCCIMACDQYARRRLPARELLVARYHCTVTLGHCCPPAAAVA